MLKIDWQPGNFFTVELPSNGRLNYGQVLSWSTSDGKRAVVMIPEDADESVMNVPQSVVFLTTTEGLEDQTDPTSRTFMFPIRETEVPARILAYLSVFCLGWRYAQDNLTLFQTN